MALAWLNVALVALLGVACVALYLDARGARKALRALERSAARQGEELVNMRRALAHLAPAQPAPTAVILRHGNMTRDERVMDRFYRLIASHGASHCVGPACTAGAVCECPCEPCKKRRDLFGHAERDVDG